MPDRFECLACHGTYDAMSADRVPYAHVCPPEILVIAQPLGGAILERPLPAWVGFTLVADAGHGRSARGRRRRPRDDRDRALAPRGAPARAP